MDKVAFARINLPLISFWYSAFDNVIISKLPNRTASMNGRYRENYEVEGTENTGGTTLVVTTEMEV